MSYDSNKLREYQLKLYDLLIEFDKVCKENAITYYLFGGTLLGAVRHKGFIPWDDDIDVVMTREEFNKFIKLLKSQGVYDVDYKKTWVPKFFVKDSQVKEDLFIDIFILDKATENHRKHKMQVLRLKFLQGMIKSKISFKNKGFLNNVLQIVTYFFGRLFTFKWKLKKYMKHSTKYNDDLYQDLFCTNMPFKTLSIVYSGNALNHYEEITFERFNFPVMCGWDEVLTKLYGDYNSLPPLENRIPEHNFNK